MSLRPAGPARPIQGEGPGFEPLSAHYAAPMKDRSVWPECREPGTHACAGSNATSECICWHHVLQQRHVEHALELLVQIERELQWIGGR